MNSSEALKSNFVRMSILLATALVGSLLFMSLNVQRSVVHGQSCLITDKTARTIPAPPSLPAAGGTMVDPTFCQTIMRVTDAGDGTDCHSFYSYWPTFNSDSTMFIFAADNIPKLGHLDPNNFQLGTKGNLFATGSLFLSTEDAIWSGSDPNVLYGHEGPRLWAYNVVSKTYTQLKDFSGQVPGGGYVWQMSKSTDDNVFAFTVRNSSDQALGYLAWRKNTDTILRNDSQANLDEVQVDKSGRYLAVKADFGPPLDFRAIDFQTGSMVTLTNGAPDYSPGHSDNGQAIVVGYDNWLNRYTRRSFPTILDPNTPHAFSVVIDLNDWSQASHLSMLANNESWCVISNYTNPGSDATGNALRQEVFQAATDGSQNVRRLAHHHSVYRDYYDTPRANISRDGKFIAFTSNWGSTTRRDVFFIKVPALTDCLFTLNPTSQSFGSGTGTGSITVTPNTGTCTWTAVSNNPSWITITSGSSGTGTGTVNYSVAANTGAARSGSITAGGLTFNISQAGVSSSVQNVIWTNPVNCTVTGNSVQKNGGGSGSCDGGAWSQQTITTLNGYVEFTVTETNKFRFCGLTATRTTNSYSALDFALDFTSASYAEVKENGVYKTDIAFVTNDLFRVSLEAGVVKYYKNGTAFYTSTKTPTFPLYANALLCDLSSTISSAVITPPCAYTIAPTMQSFGAGSGTGSITVTPNSSSCSWTAASNNTSWITITSGTSGTGNGTVNYSVAANTGATRTGSITVAGQTFSISQSASSGAQNVIWTNPINTTVSGNSLLKSGGYDGSCDGGAWSQQSIVSGNGYLEFTATETNKLRFAALTATRSTSDYTLLDFSIKLSNGASAEVRENFAYKADTPYVTNDLFRISVESGVVKYYKNGTVFYTSTKTPSFPLYADVILCSSSATITNAMFSTTSGSGIQNAIWTNIVNSTATGNSLLKTGGYDGSCDGGAWSQQSIASGNSYLEFTATETNKLRFAALTATRSTSDYTLLDFSIKLSNGASAEVRENYAYKADTPYVSGDVFRISVESGVVKYYKNGTVFYASTKTPSFPLYADAILCSSSATITNAVISGAQ
jgi:hypothetical protein